MKVKTVTILGANGTMGARIAGIFASFGNADVYLISRTIEKSREAAKKAADSVKAGSISKKLIPMDYSSLEECIKKSDLVFESVAEDFEVKKEIFLEILPYIQKNTVLCSGTSGLSVANLASLLPLAIQRRFLGIHMYNPPYSMTLCEIIPTKYTDPKIVEEVKKYVSHHLLRTAILVKDMPAFLGNRIGFQFINSAFQYADQYKYSGGIDYIDAILGQFSGRSMAPLNTSDFVGLDVHKAIVDNIYANTNDYFHETFSFPTFAKQLIADGRLGRKTKGGLYKIVKNEGISQLLVYDIVSKEYRDKINYDFSFSHSMISYLETGDYQEAFEALESNRSIEAEICLKFLIQYVIYSIMASKEAAFDVSAADDAMACGFNWCPPLAIVEALSGKDHFIQLAKERLDPKELSQIDLKVIYESIVPSKYDYRRFFKAKK